jgi:hypothetical protein
MEPLFSVRCALSRSGLFPTRHLARVYLSPEMPLRDNRAKVPEGRESGSAANWGPSVSAPRSPARARDAARARDVVRFPPPQFIDTLPQVARAALRPQDELAEIIGFDADRESARAAYAFFTAPDATDDDWVDAPLTPLPPGTRRAMLATIGMLIGTLLLVGGNAVYQRFASPMPALVGRTHVIRLPSPLSVAAAEQLARVGTVASAKPVARGNTASMTKAVVAAEPIAAAKPVPETQPIAAPKAVAPARPPAAVKPATLAKATSGRAAPAPGPAPAPASPARRTRPSAEMGLMLADAQAYAESGQTARAIKTYQTFLALGPDTAQALTALAKLELGVGSATEARAHARRATHLEPTYAAAWVVLGAAFDALREPTKAQRVYRECISQARGPHVFECARRLH